MEEFYLGGGEFGWTCPECSAVVETTGNHASGLDLSECPDCGATTREEAA